MIRHAALPSFALVSALTGCSAPPGAIDDAATTSDAATDAPVVDTADAAIDRRYTNWVSSVQSAIARGHVPGASIALVENGHLSFAAGVGLKSVDGTDPVTTSTVFRVGSMTKMLTAATLMSLAEQGQIDVTRPVTDYVPYFSVRSPGDAHAVLVRHLLTHTAGLPDGSVAACTQTLSDWFHAQTMQPLWSPPGAVWNYSNQNFELAGLVAESVAGVSYEQAVHDRVFVPAGMTTATFDVDAAMAADHAFGHMLDAAGNATRTYDATDYDCGYTRPAGFAFASASDYAHFAEVLLGTRTGVLSSASIAAMQADQVATHESPDEHYGYALFSQPYHGLRLVHHGGAIPGYLSSIMMVPERGFAVVVLLNGDSIDPDQIAVRAVDSFLGLTGSSPTYRTDPSTWGVYEGTYSDPATLGDVTVTRVDTHLHVSMPRQRVEGDLYQAAGDTFVLTVSGGGSLPITFWRDGDAPPQYLVTRLGVATRAM